MASCFPQKQLYSQRTHVKRSVGFSCMARLTKRLHLTGEVGGGNVAEVHPCSKRVLGAMAALASLLGPVPWQSINLEQKLFNVFYRFPNILNGSKNKPTLQILSGSKFAFLWVCPIVPNSYVPSCMMPTMDEKPNGCRVVFNYSQRTDFKSTYLWEWLRGQVPGTDCSIFLL